MSLFIDIGNVDDQSHLVAAYVRYRLIVSKITGPTM